MAYKPQGTKINVTITATSAAISGVVPGQRYLCTATGDCFLAEGVAAVANQGIYLPAKFPVCFKFGEIGDTVDLRIIGTASTYLTMIPVKEG